MDERHDNESNQSMNLGVRKILQTPGTEGVEDSQIRPGHCDRHR